MKVRQLCLWTLNIPFVERFRHSLKDRAVSDTVVVRVGLDDGTLGYGEGIPRPYVTGETVEGMVARVRRTLWPAIADAEVRPEGPLTRVEELIPAAHEPSGVRAHNAARCAVELALIDATLRASGRGLHDVLPPKVDEVRYSGVITGGTPESAVARANQFLRIGLNDIKIKVGRDDALERVRAVREAVGQAPRIRIDANGAWDLPTAIEALRAMEPLNVASCEEPLPACDWAGLAELRRSVSVPLMADESLVTEDDARRLADCGAVDLFNIRLSKCGGLGPSLRLAAFARERGLGHQLGAHVGETAILSAACRHLATFGGDARFVEGSYGTMLLTEDVCRTSLRFGHKGRGPALKGPGLGVQVLEERLDRYAERRVELSLS